MPGLIDMHTHITGVLDLAQPIEPVFIHAYMGRPAQIVLDMLPRAKMLLLNGFTTIRNLGDPSSTVYDLRDAINKALAVAGPRIFACERRSQSTAATTTPPNGASAATSSSSSPTAAIAPAQPIAPKSSAKKSTAARTSSNSARQARPHSTPMWK